MAHGTTRIGTTFAALGTLAALAALAPRTASAETAVEGSASFNVASRYVWRGQTLSEGLVLQPTAGIAYGGFAANLWANVDLDAAEEDDDGVAMNETDLTVSYTVPAGPVALTGGLIHYDFDGADTQELFVTVAADTLLSPALTLYWDIDEGDGGFATLAVSHELPLGPVALTAGATLGVNLDDEAMGVNADGAAFSGLYSAEVSLATSIPVFGKMTLDPRVAYSFGLGDGKDAIGAVSADGKTDVFYGSVAATFAF